MKHITIFFHFFYLYESDEIKLTDSSEDLTKKKKKKNEEKMKKK